MVYYTFIMANTDTNLMQEIVALAKRRGFIYQSSEIYGGLASVYDYGPQGVELLRNIRESWWNYFIHQKQNVVGIESQIFMHPDVWKASGHVDGFHDPLVDCKKCRNRFRADHLVEGAIKGIDGDDYDNKGLQDLIMEKKIPCPHCGNFDWTDVRNFNLMFATELGAVSDGDAKVYLRPETAQGMFVQFKNVMDTNRLKIPFGIGQIGKVFRNEITKGKFIFRTLEFEQMELQYFIKEDGWEETFEMWRGEIEKWYTDVLGIDKSKFIWKPHNPDKLAHYAKKAEDYEYQYSWGHDEVSGLHYRTDFDLSTHQKHSGKSLEVLDQETNTSFVPHVIESTFGLNRVLLMLLTDAYTVESNRTVLKLSVKIAPYKAAIFPLLANKPELVDKARGVFDNLSETFNVAWDARGNIGKRYLAQDEIGTPYCITIDFDSLNDDTVTVRDRDTTNQERVNISKLAEKLQVLLS